MALLRGVLDPGHARLEVHLVVLMATCGSAESVLLQHGVRHLVVRMDTWRPPVLVQLLVRYLVVRMDTLRPPLLVQLLVRHVVVRMDTGRSSDLCCLLVRHVVGMAPSGRCYTPHKRLLAECCFTSTETVPNKPHGFCGRYALCLLVQNHMLQELSGPARAVQCGFMSTETVRTIRDGEPRTTTSTFTQLLRSDHPRVIVSGLHNAILSSRVHSWGAVWKTRWSSRAPRAE